MQAHLPYGYENDAMVPISGGMDAREDFLMELGVSLEAMPERLEQLKELIETERWANFRANVKFALDLCGNAKEAIILKRAFGLSEKKLIEDARTCGKTPRGLRKAIRRVKKKFPSKPIGR